MTGPAIRRGMRSAALSLVAAALVGSPPAPADEGRRFLLIVSGLGGEEYYSSLFHRWSLDLLDVAHQRYGIDDAHTVYLAERPGVAPGRIDGVSRKEDVVAAVDALGRRSAPGDRVLIMLIGHGTAQERDARFNLPGPDLAPGELAAALESLDGRRLAVINSAPASGPFVPALSTGERIVVAATANASEIEHTRFAGHFIEALADDTADADKDGTVSLLEAFRFARHELDRVYEDDGRVLTEHAQLDDDGDGRGSLDPGAEGTDGAAAGRFHLAGPADTGDDASTARVALQLEARDLVDRIERLKQEKRLLPTETYERRLETLLVELAFNRRAYREETGR